MSRGVIDGGHRGGGAARPEGPTLRLRKPLERALRDGHPWVYRDAVDGDAEPGSVATLLDARGAFVARGIADSGPIALRVLTTRDEAVGPELLAARVARAAELRDRVVPEQTDAYRLLHGEGDGLPGFVCDVYGPYAVLKTDGAGAAAWRSQLAEVLRPALEPRGVRSLLLREPSSSARRRNAPARDGAADPGAPPSPPLAVLHGEAPPPGISVRERGMTLRVDLWRGQKTGLFLDQRESRARVRGLAGGLRVLNLYAYTGGFSAAAGLGGAAQVESVDVAPGAVQLAGETWAANGLDPARHRAVLADVPERLAVLARERARFDLVVSDPPSFAPSEQARDAALASYRALHASCLSLLAPGGYYLAASCSSHVDRAAFAQSVLEGSRRAKRVLQALDAWGAPPDHPRLAAFPEGDYLKVMLYRAP